LGKTGDMATVYPVHLGFTTPPQKRHHKHTATKTPPQEHNHKTPDNARNCKFQGLMTTFARIISSEANRKTSLSVLVGSTQHGK